MYGTGTVVDEVAALNRPAGSQQVAQILGSGRRVCRMPTASRRPGRLARSQNKVAQRILSRLSGAAALALPESTTPLS
jgi:hypothetical protein